MTAIQLGFDALEQTAKRHEVLIERLAAVANTLALTSPTVTVGDVREAAVRMGILTGREKGRELSYLGAVMRKAGLRPLPTYRRSHLDVTHGNLNREWSL